MPVVTRPELTDRERAVLDGIDRRLPLKAVAAEIGVSESRVNQHVRALKERFAVNTLTDLVDAWRREDAEISTETDCRTSAWRNSQVPGADRRGESGGRVAPGEFVLSDAALIAIEAPWAVENEPRVVPGMLDGDNAVLLRLAVIIGITFGLVAAVVLVVTASLALSEALQGNAAVPEEQSPPTG
ncbi:LuxR C-terminal-related transcriptional regulator [Tsuneonella sp. YG55]|uniref:LuxR C-terminal-related transcriptional regulator n=1 Tax=Tsuneonella litorea TaxID=2976475 RepID=A0A9X2W2U5_9SPHN|nr:LuxR C-terminal-related transcriptional regulator [Tsuneonella litorea]MCT2559194.1 LuxR C-terminal-related transcriptional regulator [Tsuneonella litorea]